MTSLNRRDFIKRSTLAAAGASASAYLAGCATASVSRHKAGDKLNVVQIGCGGRAMSHLKSVIQQNKQNLYAIVDPDEKRQAAVLNWLAKTVPNAPQPQAFFDYRVMYDRIGKNIDAAFIATPNHHHATAAMIGLEVGKNVYCEKPLCHDVFECRRLAKMSLHHPRQATQMGNQGHCEEGYRRLCEYIWAGVIGNVTETHSWTDRANGGVGPRPPILPVPAGMHWDTWIGPAPYRDFHSDLHPHEWHGWYDFGNGSIGNMGCHVLDGAFWALKLGHPDSVEVEAQRGGSDERYPLGSRIRWDFPARGEMPPVKVYWYEGLKQDATGSPVGSNDSVKGAARNLPPILLELQKKYPDEEFDTNGTIYIGEKGYIYTGTYGERMHIVPMETMVSTPKPPVTLARPKDVFTDFVNACLENRTNTATPFTYGARLTEFAILGNLAQHVGAGRKVEWDGPGMLVKNIPELNAWVHHKPRSGWAV